jgi:SET domain-containing protein
VKPINFLHNAVYAAKTRGKGRGMFANTFIKPKTVIETAPVIVMSGDERKLLDQTLLHDYIFEWDDDKGLCCMALGYIALYNHSYGSNCEYEMDFKQGIISIKTVRTIEAGEELLINYNGDWNNNKPVWFDVQ